jgi:hypothetical protein
MFIWSILTARRVLLWLLARHQLGPAVTGISYCNMWTQYLVKLWKQLTKRACTTIYSFSAAIPPQDTVIGVTFKVIYSKLLNAIPCRKYCVLYVTKQNINEYSQTMLEVSISFLKTSIKCKTSGLKIFQNSRIHLKILSTRKLTRSKFHTKDSQIIFSTTQNLVLLMSQH